MVYSNITIRIDRDHINATKEGEMKKFAFAAIVALALSTSAAHAAFDVLPGNIMRSELPTVMNLAEGETVECGTIFYEATDIGLLPLGDDYYVFALSEVPGTSDELCADDLLLF